MNVTPAMQYTPPFSPQQHVRAGAQHEAGGSNLARAVSDGYMLRTVPTAEHS